MGNVFGTKRLLSVFLCSAAFACAGPMMQSTVSAAEGDDAVNLFDVGGEDGPKKEQTVKVGAAGQIDLHVDNLDITKVLQLLSIQSQRNIIASKNVSGTITADLYGVDFYEALDAILNTNGFGYEEKGQFIYVSTAQELAERQEANRKVVTKIVRLSYINAQDMAAFVQPMLSSSGSISVSGAVKGGIQPSISDAGENSFAHEDTIVIRDYEENLEEILAVVKELDIRPKQVLIESTILQAALGEKNAFGVDFALFGDLELTDFTNPLSAVDNLISGSGEGGAKLDSGSAGTSSAGATTGGQSGVKVGVLGSSGALFIRALDQVTNTTVVARPKVLVLNRQRSDLLVGERLGYLSTTVTDTSNTQSVEFLDIGTQLSVRPFVGADEDIRLELRPSLSDGSTRLEGGFIIPDQTTQEIVTNVIVESGKTVVLGGFFKEDTGVGRSQVPGLGDVPIAGLLGKGQDDEVTRSEVIFLVKPTLMRHESLIKMGKGAEDAVHRTRVGARRNLLPWSNTKLTAAHMRDAHKYMADGNKDKALWHLNSALHIDPTMGDALAMKAELTGEALNLYESSMLEGIVAGVIDNEVDEVAPAEEPAVEATEEAAEAPAEAATEEVAEADAATEEDPMDAETTEEATAEAPAETATEEIAMEADATEEAAADAPAEAVSEEVAEADAATEEVAMDTGTTEEAADVTVEVVTEEVAEADTATEEVVVEAVTETEAAAEEVAMDVEVIEEEPAETPATEVEVIEEVATTPETAEEAVAEASAEAADETPGDVVWTIDSEDTEELSSDDLAAVVAAQQEMLAEEASADEDVIDLDNDEIEVIETVSEVDTNDFQ